jgi:hypothetical protein
MKQALIIGGITVAVLGLGTILFIQDAKNSNLRIDNDNSSTTQVGQEISNQGQQHIKNGESHEPYNSNPPTSGPHYIQPANWAVYSTALVDEQAVHNLEHGGIWISYKDIDEVTISQLEKIAKANGGSVIMSPRPNNDSKIALASWTRLEKLENYDEAKILEFIKANKNKSPEPLAR